MANIIPDGFKSELLKGSHNFAASGGNTFYIALYDTTLGPPYTTSSTVYSATNECSSAGGSNYPGQPATKTESNQYTFVLASAATSATTAGGFPSFAGPVGDRP